MCEEIYTGIELYDQVMLCLTRADGDVDHSVDAQLPYIFDPLRSEVPS